MVQQILRINHNTIFKLRPELASDLKPEELYSVTAGATYEIQSYAYASADEDFNGHIKFALKNQAIRGLNTWFVYSLHAQVESDGEVVYPREDQASLPILRIAKDTVFKRRPLQSTMLSSSELYTVERGSNYNLQSYAYADAQGDFSSHIKFTLRNESDFIRGLNTWFVYDQDAYVEFDGVVVYPSEDPDTPLLRVLVDTVFKRRPLATSSLAANELYSVRKGTLLKLQSYAYADQRGDFDHHIKFTLKYEKDFIQYLSTWYVYDQHARVEREGKVVYPIPKPAPAPTPTYQGRAFKLPGNTSTFYTDQPIIPGGNFTWGEATKDGTRIPDDVTIVNNIIALARELQKARNQIGRPFQINSWYRPPAINEAVGGASGSQHLVGKAADIEVPGYSGRRIANAVMAWWPGGVGIYSNMPNLVHLDVGPRRMWGF
jgi:hypothetical protein